MLAWLGQLFGRLIPDDLFDCWLEEGEYSAPDPTDPTDLRVPSFERVCHFDFDDYPLTPVEMIPAPPDDSEHW